MQSSRQMNNHIRRLAGYLPDENADPDRDILKTPEDLDESAAAKTAAAHKRINDAIRENYFYGGDDE